MPIAVTDEQLAMAESVGQWAKRAGTVAAVRAMESSWGQAADSEFWVGLAELGVFSIVVPEELGGADGTVADLAVVVEQLATWLVPGPVLPTLLAGMALAGAAGPHQAADANEAGTLLCQVMAGSASVGVALSADGLSGTQSADRGMTVTGTARLVLGAGDVTHLLLAARAGSRTSWFAVRAGEPGVLLTPRTPVDFSRPLADVTLDGFAVRPGQLVPGLRTGQVRDLAGMLAAAEAVGVAAWCSQTGAEYARTRRQFGRPIGSFQAVKHLCAGMLCRAELASAAAWDAACAADDAPDELPLTAAAAAAVALDAAVDNAKDCIQVLGGIGFTWEHDAHLYLRRALALRQLLGGSARCRARAAELAIAGMRRHPRDGEGSSRFNGSHGDDDVRSAARAAAVRILALPPDRQRTALADSGYAAPHWPVPYGLSAAGPAQLVIDSELANAGLTRPDLAIGGWAVPAILSHGTPAQRERFAGPTLRGEITWCQLFSEPEAGSDLASLRTRAVRTDGGWLLTGQKVWTSLAAEADWAICLARTDPDAPKHKGITFFLVQMDGPGIDIRPLREITGREMFNEVFLDEVLVPDECVVGGPGAGWRIARATLATERVAMGRGAALGDEAEDLLAAVGTSGGAAGRGGEAGDAGSGDAGSADAANSGALDPTALDQLGARLAEGLALSAMDDRLARAVLRGADPGFQSAVRKLLGVAHRQAVAETALTLCGTQGAAADGPGAGPVHQFLLTRCLSIAGGTSQILMSLVAERMLGLPREEAR